MRFDCCRISGLSPFASLAPGTIPGSIEGQIPDVFSATNPIYFEGPISLEEFLASTREDAFQNDIDMRPSDSSKTFMWPVTSRLSFVSSLTIAVLTAIALCTQAQAMDGKNEHSTRFAEKENIRIAHNAPSIVSSEVEPDSHIISFVCGRPNTLQALAPIDLSESDKQRLLPQGASPIAEMKYMPAVRKCAQSEASAMTKEPPSAPLDIKSVDQIYNKLLKLSHAHPAIYNAEAPSLITYFSILTGGKDQKRVEELEKILERNLNEK